MQRAVFFTLVILMAVLTSPAMADRAEKKSLVYYEDPVYQSISPGDEHPMKELTAMAEGGDTRAQFILGDLYAKGKGGLVKNEEKGAKWFEESAKNGYGPSYIRLAALAKRRNDNVAAWSWYDLGSSYASGKDARYAGRARDKLENTAKLSSEDIASARKLSADFRRARDEARDKRAEAEAARRAAETKEKDKPAAAKDTAKDKAGDKPKEKAEAYTPPSFTQRFNP